MKIAALVASTILVAVSTGGPVGATGTTALIQGSGSSWSANAVQQWISDVQQQALQIVYTPTGSAQGRQDFANRVTDFAVSDIGYQGVDPVTGAVDTSNGRQFAYLPMVAGGTAFPYQVRVGGQLVRNIRLSGLTLTKIFTNQITNWDDPEITADNNGRQLPSLPIIAVVHSEGAGSTAQFTLYLATEYPGLWKAFAGYSSFTEYYPRAGSQIAQNGSDGVMNFVSSSAANGAIGYDEYSYALGQNYPVAKIENSSGYFTAPTQYNVAVALTQAQINMDKSSPNYLLENLTNVYSYSDDRTYPLSSYSYMILPTAANDSTMTTAKRQTLADFLGYSICRGQAEIGPIGYSPLPINLVEASFAQTALLKSADPGVNLTQETVASCNNPTFEAGQPNVNYLAQIAPQPPACDKAGAGPCTGNQGLANGNPLNGQATSAPAPNATRSPGSRSPGTAGAGPGSNATGSASSGATSGSTGTNAGSSGSVSTQSGSAATGSASGSTGSDGTTNDNSGSGSGPVQLAEQPELLAAGGPPGSLSILLSAVTALCVICLLALPPWWLRRRKAEENREPS